jgi:hypothetical protein
MSYQDGYESARVPHQNQNQMNRKEGRKTAEALSRRGLRVTESER